MKKIGKRALSVLLAGSLLLGEAAVCKTAAPVYAAEQAEAQANYVSDVFVAYGRTESDAKKWLEDNGWEAIKGDSDLNVGKASGDGENVAAVLGIRRTDDPAEAITDIAAVNMRSDYSIPQYNDLIEKKNAEINEFINDFLPAIREYRANYNGEGSEAGKKRAQIAHDLLNKFYDGGKEEKYSQNDTGEVLGDLFLKKLRQEEGGEKGGDFRQIILESCSLSVTAIESVLALASDTDEKTWLERLPMLTEEELEENIGTYCPSAAGVDVAPSAVEQYYDQEYKDAAKKIAKQWDDIHDKINWYKNYNDEHDLLKHEDESDAQYKARYEKFFADLKEEDPYEYDDLIRKYDSGEALYTGLALVSYSGEWGETLGDFFDPEGEATWKNDYKKYVPMAVALSKGQRSSLEVIPLQSLLMAGLTSKKAVDNLFGDLKKVMDKGDPVSVYSGINRGIFRDGVALTPTALQKAAEGENPYAEFDLPGYEKVLLWTGFMSGVVLMMSGTSVLMHVQDMRADLPGEVQPLRDKINKLDIKEKAYDKKIDYLKETAEGEMFYQGSLNERLKNAKRVENTRQEFIAQQAKVSDEIGDLKSEIERMETHVDGFEIIGTAASCIGVALLVSSIITGICEVAAAKAAYYNKDFCRIPTMMVDENDITHIEKDDDGNDRQCIEFDQYVYYQAVKCNRREAGNLSKKQNGVDKYAEWGCGDIADVNCDHGLEWLALYTIKNQKKGAPILADTLALSYSKEGAGSDSVKLHYFNNLGVVNIADRAYCYNNAAGKEYICLSWNGDKNAVVKSDEKAKDSKDKKDTDNKGKDNKDKKDTDNEDKKDTDNKGKTDSDNKTNTEDKNDKTNPDKQPGNDESTDVVNKSEEQSGTGDAGEATEYVEPKVEIGEATEYVEPKVEIGEATEYVEPKVEIGEATEYVEPKVEIGEATEYVEPKVEIGEATEYVEPETTDVEDPEQVPEAPAEEAAGQDVINWTIADGVLTVSGSGKVVQSPWKSRKGEIVKVVIEDGVTGIGQSAFYGCDKLEEVIVPSCLETIGQSAFANCYALKSFMTADMDPALGGEGKAVFSENIREIGLDAFLKCNGIKDVYFFAGDYSGYAFDDEAGVAGYRYDFINPNATTIHIPESVGVEAAKAQSAAMSIWAEGASYRKAIVADIAA